VVFHVGSVEEVRQDGSILTIEGNADPPRRTRRRQVMRKLRRVGIVLTASEVSRPPADTHQPPGPGPAPVAG
jgi:surface antigen